MPLLPTYEPLRVFVGTWNAGNLEPPFTATDGSPLSLSAWLLPNGEASPSCDVYVVGFQELSGGGADHKGGKHCAADGSSAPVKSTKWRKRSVPGRGGPAHADRSTAERRSDLQEGVGSDTVRQAIAALGAAAAAAAAPANSSPPGGGGGGGVDRTSAVPPPRADAKGWKMRMEALGGLGSICRRSGEPQRQSTWTATEGLGPPEHMGALLGSILGDDFLLLEAVPMYQIHLFVFVRISHIHHVSDVTVSKVSEPSGRPLCERDASVTRA